jgi:hypothetical protein
MAVLAFAGAGMLARPAARRATGEDRAVAARAVA